MQAKQMSIVGKTRLRTEDRALVRFLQAYQQNGLNSAGACATKALRITVKPGQPVDANYLVADVQFSS